uniref:Uncharacterized protein n=1 Tax=Arundo donax TaxID=35708 RepID=A0A0A9ASD0_ARUDO
MVCFCVDFLCVRKLFCVYWFSLVTISADNLQ